MDNSVIIVSKMAAVLYGFFSGLIVGYPPLVALFVQAFDAPVAGKILTGNPPYLMVKTHGFSG